MQTLLFLPAFPSDCDGPGEEPARELAARHGARARRPQRARARLPARGLLHQEHQPQPGGQLRHPHRRGARRGQHCEFRTLG